MSVFSPASPGHPDFDKTYPMESPGDLRDDALHELLEGIEMHDSDGSSNHGQVRTKSNKYNDNIHNPLLINWIHRHRQSNGDSMNVIVITLALIQLQ